MIIIGVIVVLFFSNKKQSPEETINPKTIPVITVQSIKVIDEKIFFPSLSKEQKAIFYFGDKGIKSKKYSLEDQKISEVYPENIYSLVNTKYSPNFKKVLLPTQKGDKFYYQVFDLEQKKFAILPEKIFDVEWLGDDKIIYSYNDGEKNSLKVSSWDGKDWQKLSDLDIFDPLLTISPDNKKIIIYPQPAGFGKNPLYLYGLATKEIEKISGNEALVGASWSPNNQTIITSQVDNYGNPITLKTIDIHSKTKKDIPLKTGIDKVIWLSDNSLFAAEPQKNTSDILYQIEIDFDKTTQLKYASPQNIKIDAQNLMLTQDNKTLYFTSNNLLYKLAIP